MNQYLAQVSNPLNSLCGIGNIGLCPPVGPTNATSLLASVLSTAIGLLTVVAALYFMFVLITGAIGIISAGQDKTALEDAKKRITNGAIGLVITIAAIFLIEIISTLLGIPSILDIGQLINAIRLQ